MDEMSKASDLLDKVEEQAKAQEANKELPVDPIATETVKEATAPIEVKDVVIVDTTDTSNVGMATIETNELVEDGKTLAEYAYDTAADELKKKAEKEALEFMKEDQLPAIELREVEKEKAIEEITQGLEDIIESKGSDDYRSTLEAMATNFYKQLDKKDTDIILLKAKNEDLEKIVKEQQSENLKLKHGSSKIDIDDDFIGGFAVTYKDRKNADKEIDKIKLSEKLAKIMLGGTKMIFPEFEVDDVLNIVKERRASGLKSIQGLTQGGQRDLEIQEKAKVANRPSPYVYSTR